MSILATLFLLAAVVACAASIPAIVTETHVTSFTEQKCCDNNWIIAYNLFTGKSNNELA
ncbi:hypothetical protein BKA63DRAFT_568094 [Paraphoma chrysanthemicola]|nr:hypothetical protein BKA63DRAFT_568094 [Paraphoma chrysanthemicola]